MAFGRPADDVEIEIDGWDDIDENPFYVPPGTYDATAVSCEEGETKESKAKKLIFTFAVVSKDKAINGKELKVHAVRSEAAAWRVKQVLIGLGFPQQGKSLKLKLSDVPGKKCRIEVVDRDYQGETRSDIKKVLPPNPAPVAAAKPAK